MKKSIIVISIFIITVFLVSCRSSLMSEVLINDKTKIVEDKYGEVQYIKENIFIYKNMEDELNHIENIDYIINNSGNRGSVAPEFANNFYVIIDIVKHEDEFKILVYNNIMKKSSDKRKMFVLTDYFLPITIEDITNIFSEKNINQSINELNIVYGKKDTSDISISMNTTNNDDLTIAIYNKQSDGDLFISLHDNKAGNSLIWTKSETYLGNVESKEIYYPKGLEYKDLINDKYNTLNDYKLDFSLNKGETFKNVDDRLIDFDIWNESINSEVFENIFFYAFSYQEFISKVELARKPNIYTYQYPNDNEFDLLIEKYNEEYFENNILIFYYKFERNISENYIYSVTKYNDTLTINVNRYEGMSTALSSWLEIITIKKEDVKEIKRVNLIVRTISELQSYIVAYINDEYIKDFYLNEKDLDDFKDLDNLKEINSFTWSLNVDLIFNKSISDDDLNLMINYLEDNPNVKSIGYKGKDFIRVQLINNFYLEVVNKTLLLRDFIEDEKLIEDYSLSIKILNFTPIAYIKFILEEKGRDQAFKMIEDIKKMDYHFLKIEWLYSE